MTGKILVVEDDIALRETLAYSLDREGFSIRAASDGLQALTEARNFLPDLILLDLMLPGMDGVEVCRTIRQDSTVPILMLTARAGEIDRVVGLEVGADDYLVKPFHMRELIARVKALLRRVRMVREENTSTAPREAAILRPILLGDLTLDLQRGEVSRSGQVVNLKPKEFELLVFFAQHLGQALSREQILQQVWGWEFTGDSRTIDVHIHWLREKIEPDPSNPQRLVTVRGSGYRFEG